MEAERGHNRGLVGRIVAFDVAGRIGFGVSLGLGVLEHVIELQALGGHLVENVVGGAVDDAQHAGHLVARQGFAQRQQERDGATNGRFEVDVDALGLGRGVDFRAVLGKQRLVGGDHGGSRLDRGHHERAGHCGAADQLDDDVGVGGDLHRVGRQQRLVDPGEVHLIGIQAGHADQLDRTPDAGSEFVLLLHQQTCGL